MLPATINQHIATAENMMKGLRIPERYGRKMP
jgi:hypothetical protein